MLCVHFPWLFVSFSYVIGKGSASNNMHDDVIKWKHFPRNWPFAGKSPVPGEFPAQRPVTRSFDVFFDLCLNKRLSKQSWGWWFETPSRQLWRHRKDATPWSPFNNIDEL